MEPVQPESEKKVEPFTTGSVTSRLRAEVSKAEPLDLRAKLDEVYRDAVPGFGENPNAVLTGMLFNPIRLAGKYIAGLAEAPLNQTIQEGLVNNPPLWDGLERLEQVTKDSGLQATLKEIGTELRVDQYPQQLRAEGRFAKGAATAIAKKLVVPALNGSENAREAVADMLATLIVQATKGTAEAGLDGSALKALVKSAGEKAVDAIEKGTAPDMSKATRTLAAEILRTQADKITRG